MVILAAASLALLPAEARAEAAGAPKGKTELTWYGQSAFVLRTPGGTVLVIDPWFKGPRSPDKDAGAKLEKVDRILLTHGHPDHVGEAIELSKRTGAKVTAQNDLVRSLWTLGLPKEAGDGSLGNVGGVFEIGDATVAIVPAVHSSQVVGENGAALPGGSPVGFVIQVKGGPTLYHTGDTDLFSDMKLIPERYGRVDVMLACIGGNFTMDPKGAAVAATWVKARTVVPMHFGTSPQMTGTPKALEAALKGKAKVLVLEPGRPALF
jgi:L-ascorbate metabolism protein UlaG (beta-lactamase superfamily)